MQSLKKIPYYLLLLVLFFCLHGLAEHYGLIDWRELLFIGSTIAACMAVLLGLLWLLMKKRFMAAALTCLFISTWYLFFGAWVDALAGIRYLSYFSSYTKLVPLLCLLSIGWAVLLVKKPKLQPGLTYFFNLLLIIYCLIDVGTIWSKSRKPLPKAPALSHFDKTLAKEKPNVYLLVFDEYAGYKSLQDSFAFRNDSFYNGLERRGFSSLPLFSNYDFTLFSMSSMLNMRYIPIDHPEAVAEKDLQHRTIEIRHAAVFDMFRSMGYSIHNYSIFDIGDQQGVANRSSFLPVHSQLLTDKILHNRIMRTSLWMLRKGKLGEGIRRKMIHEHEVNNNRAEALLMNTVPAQKGAPAFYIGHFLMPHWPYYKDSAGRPVPDSILGESINLRDKALYLSYLKYSNTHILSMADRIISNDPGAIVILMSDHGFRNYLVDYTDPLDYDNIAFVRLPAGKAPFYKEKWSNINLFPYLLNHVYGQRMPYLPDSTVFLRYK